MMKIKPTPKLKRSEQEIDQALVAYKLNVITLSELKIYLRLTK